MVRGFDIALSAKKYFIAENFLLEISLEFMQRIRLELFTKGISRIMP